MRTDTRLRSVFVLVIATDLLMAMTAFAQEAADYFRQNCANCHTVGGGRLTGPDLKDVSRRKERAWLVSFMQNPKAVIDSGDAYAQKLFQDSRGVVMPSLGGMTPARAQALLDLLDAESKLPQSQFIGMQISDRPFTPADVAEGREYFLGNKRFLAKGPNCISCHSVKALGGLGGGRLGPDLTLVYERLQGRRPLAAWLVSPASPTMQPLYKAHALRPEEILPLVAYLEDAAKKGGEDDSAALLNFFLFGVGGTVLALVLFDTVWKRRFRAVRRPLVHKDRRAQQ